MMRILSELFSKLTTFKAIKLPKLPKDKQSKVDWISAEEDGDEAERPDEKLPMFFIGDNVLIFNPYTQEMVVNEYEISPEFYEITDVKYDDEEEVFRYQLKNGEINDWYSEDWLSLPMATTFIREWVPNKKEGLTMKMEEIEQSILFKALDDSAKQTQVDALLERMNGSVSVEEKAECKRQLAEITGGVGAE